ncbi:hypothetical protein [Nocardia sp. NPDC050435]|uniref:hypothetical protein n=1 Tax=Nocardia sp. NPDC050435 TaxID=3155040 RepID=UPI00340574F5
MNPACGDRRGTRTGYARHRRANQSACAACKEAEARYKTPTPRPVPECGTEAMFGRHRRRGERCATCRKAVTELDKVRKKNRRANAAPRPAEPIIHVPRNVFARLYLNASIADQLHAEQHIPENRIQRCVAEHNLAA